MWTQLSGLDVSEDIICRSGVELSKTGDSFSGSVSNFHERHLAKYLILRSTVSFVLYHTCICLVCGTVGGVL